MSNFKAQGSNEIQNQNVQKDLLALNHLSLF
jgi:hypothetical protein